jgi:hypothetical protein
MLRHACIPLHLFRLDGPFRQTYRTTRSLPRYSVNTEVRVNLAYKLTRRISIELGRLKVSVGSFEITWGRVWESDPGRPKNITLWIRDFRESSPNAVSAINAHVSHASFSTTLGARGVGSVAVFECYFELKSKPNLAAEVACEKMHTRFVFSIRVVLRERWCRSYLWNYCSWVWHWSLLVSDAVSTHEAAPISEELSYLWRVSAVYTLWTPQTLKMKAEITSKSLYTNLHGVTSEKIWTFINTPVRNSNLAWLRID